MNNRKKILVVNPISLFPIVMMSQRRALNQIYSLAKNHEVDVVTFIKNEEVRKNSEKALLGKINSLMSIDAINYDGRLIKKYYYNLKFLLLYKFFGIRIAVSNFSSNYSRKEVAAIINQKKYDIVIAHYWWSAFFFLEKLIDNPIKVLDLHGMVDEDIQLNKNSIYYRKNHRLEKKTNKNNIKFQRKIYNSLDLVVANSLSQVKILKKKYPDLNFYYCPNGQDLNQFIPYRKQKHDKYTILFYGTLNSLQNRRAFEMFYKNVWPIILEKESAAKLLIVGNNPPNDIKILSKYSNITVTGYVEDIRTYIVKACCFVLPMDIGIGFRGRVVEVMGLGIPIIGNHNALDCIGLDHEINGFVTDEYEEMAKYALKLIHDEAYREKISQEAIRFIDKNYSMIKTFDKFSEFITSLKSLE